MERRQLLKLTALLIGSAVSGSCSRALDSAANLHAAPSGDAMDQDVLAEIARLAELIIPETDTPGAIEAGVPNFIHNVVYNWYTDEERAIFIRGLEELDALSDAEVGTRFIAAPEAVQIAILERLEASLPPDPSVSEGGGGDAPFFAKLKELTVIGYYTSEIGASIEHRYIPVPGRYEGDALLENLGRQWSVR